MPNMSIELHDSVIGEIKINNDEVRVFFSVFILHVSDGRPGVDAGVVYLQEAELLFQGICNFKGVIKEYPLLISDGKLEINDLTWQNEIPVPLDKIGKIKLSISPRDIGDEIIITADRVSLKLIGDPKYLEKFSGM